MEYFVLIKFSDHEVDCVSSRKVKNCVPLEQLKINSMVEIINYGCFGPNPKRSKNDTPCGDEEQSYFGKVLSKSGKFLFCSSMLCTHLNPFHCSETEIFISESRPEIISIMETFIKTGALPGKGKRPRIPKRAESEEESAKETNPIREKKRSKVVVLFLFF
jgi:hypothetical protein